MGRALREVADPRVPREDAPVGGSPRAVDLAVGRGEHVPPDDDVARTRRRARGPLERVRPVLRRERLRREAVLLDPHARRRLDVDIEAAHLRVRVVGDAGHEVAGHDDVLRALELDPVDPVVVGVLGVGLVLHGDRVVVAEGTVGRAVGPVEVDAARLARELVLEDVRRRLVDGDHVAVRHERLRADHAVVVDEGVADRRVALHLDAPLGTRVDAVLVDLEALRRRPRPRSPRRPGRCGSCPRACRSGRRSGRSAGRPSGCPRRRSRGRRRRGR